MRTNHRERGFSAVEGLIVVVVVLLIGALGYVFITKTNTQMASKSGSATAHSEVSQLKQDMSDINVDASIDTTDVDSVLQ